MLFKKYSFVPLLLPETLELNINISDKTSAILGPDIPSILKYIFIITKMRDDAVLMFLILLNNEDSCCCYTVLREGFIYYH